MTAQSVTVGLDGSHSALKINEVVTRVSVASYAHPSPFPAASTRTLAAIVIRDAILSPLSPPQLHDANGNGCNDCPQQRSHSPVYRVVWRHLAFTFLARRSQGQ
jgi:hypothetical protein